MSGGRLFLCGAGNPDGVRLALRINAADHRWDRLVLLDDNPATHGHAVLGVEVTGTFELLREADTRCDESASLITRTTRRRWAARDRIATHGLRAATLISPAVDTLGAETSDDVIVYSGAELGVESRVGRSSAILVGARVGHESIVGECCVVGPGAVLNARVRLEEGAYVGSNAVILPEVTIGAWATIGAGAVVMDDVPAGAVVVVSPAEVVRGGAPREVGGSPSTPLGEPAASVSHGDMTVLVKQAWLEVLRQRDVSATVNFFEAGGDSLAAVRVLKRLQNLDGVRLTLVDFYRFPTIESLAHHLSTHRAVEANAQRRMESRQRLVPAARATPAAAAGKE